MKQDLPLLALILFLLIDITGCSVVRFAETRIGYGVKSGNKTDLDFDFRLGFNSTDGSLSVTLEHQPYRIYKPRITLTDVGVGFAALGLFGKVYYDHWNHKYTPTFTDDTFDWYGTQPWEKAVLIGVPIDFLLYWCFSYPFDRKAVRLPRQPLTGHEYRIELPDHGSIGINYRATARTEQIDIQNFLSELNNPPNLENIGSLKFRASTEVNGMRYKRDYIVSGFIRLPPPPPPPPPQRIEVEGQWIQSRLRAGDRATLEVNVKNTGKTILTNFIVKTVSIDPHLDGWELAFGDIAQGASETRTLRCIMDQNMRPQETVTIRLQFQDAMGVVHPDIETQLEIIE